MLKWLVSGVLSISEIGRILGVDQSTVHTWIYRGRIPEKYHNRVIMLQELTEQPILHYECTRCNSPFSVSLKDAKTDYDEAKTVIDKQIRESLS